MIDGDQWFESREGLGPIPLYDDLNAASGVLSKYTALQERLVTRLTDENVGFKIATDIWKTFVQNTTYTNSRVLIGSFHHDEPNELYMLQSTFQNNVTAARIEESKRDLNWLREHGTCGDHIIAQPSTMKQASLGAFATRFLPNDTIVAQLPMIHVTNRSRFNIYPLILSAEGRYMPYTNTIVGQQLLLNYCYGHNESSLLLCPYGPMVSYVNHNQTLANVRLRWGRSESGNHMPTLLESSLAYLETDATAKLAMELIAIRDIQEGEEIFLDYGHEWETAWQAHVDNWEPVANSESYRSAAQLEDDNVTRLRTAFEEIEHPTYADSLQLKCDSSVYSFPAECLEHYQNGTLEHFLWKTDLAWWPCSILRYRMDNETGDYLYTIHLYETTEDGTTITNSNLIEDVPRAGIHFADKPYTSDVFLPNAFRHDIRIPDDIFPVAWRNLRKQ
jgi:SET domain